MGDLKRVSADDLQNLLPGHRDWRKERESAAARKVDTLMGIWNKGLSGEALFLARILIQCGLPVTPEPSGVVTRTARTGQYERVSVTFSVTDPNIPLPFGNDRLMAHFLTTKAVRKQSTLLNWNDVNEYLAVFGQYERSGRNHRLAQERFIRLAFMNITVLVVDTKNDVTSTMKVPLIGAARISGGMDTGTGKWTVRESPRQLLMQNTEALQIDPIFFSRFLEEGKSVPVPIELILATAKSPRLMDFALFLYWRCFAARSETVITWEQLKGQFDARSGDVQFWKKNFRKVLTIIKSLPTPINLMDVKVTSVGILLRPFPDGTQFFDGHPKLKFRPSSVGE
jgi:hypothetical protein